MNTRSSAPDSSSPAQPYRFHGISRSRLSGATSPLAFSLLCFILSLSSVAAQTRTRRAGDKPDEPAGAAEPVKRDNTKPAAQSPLVRKTALTYSPRAESQNAGARPSLVNDMTIISLADEASPVTDRLPAGTTASKAGVPLGNIPSIWPVAGPLRGGYGVRSNPFGGSSLEFHKGQDISAAWGTPVVGTANGTVVIAGWQRGYGWVVYLDHGNGLSTRYGHLSRIDVAVGQTIKRGEQLGLVGSTGRSTGPHLHYEVRMNGQPINPIPYLPSLSPLGTREETGRIKSQPTAQ
ncbi:MAG TPA: M23 family metallopeptidase [Pyrinomonadaceae bacterium]